MRSAPASGGSEFWRDIKPIEKRLPAGCGSRALSTRHVIWLDENGEPTGTFDAYDYLEFARSRYEQAGPRRRSGGDAAALR